MGVSEYFTRNPSVVPSGTCSKPTHKAWRDFINKQQEAPILPRASASAPTSLPSFTDALKSRPLRVLASIAGLLLALSIVSAAAGGPGQDHFKSAIRYSGWDRSSSTSLSYGALDPDPVHAGFQKQPKFTKDPTNGYLYPPDLQPAHLNPYRRASATFVSLVRNSECACPIAFSWAHTSG